MSIYTNYEENPFAGFFQQNDGGKNLWKFLGTFLWVPYFQNIIGWVPMTRGFNPISFWAQIWFFLAVIHLLVITKCSKWPNRIGNTVKTFVERPKLQRVVKGPLILSGSNKCQNCLKMSGNMLVNLIIQNSRFYYIFDMRRNFGLFQYPKH